MTRLLSTAALLLALAACASPAATSSSSAGRSGQQSVAPTTTRAGTSTIPSTAASPARTSVPGAQTTPGTTELNASNHFPIIFDMPACIERARPATATLRTAKLSMVIASAAYSDGENHGSLWTGSTDARGVYSIAWTPPPDTPLGPAQIVAGVNGEKGGATARRFFTLAAPGGCR